MQAKTNGISVFRKICVLLTLVTSCTYSHAEFSITDDGATLYLYENRKLVLGFTYRSSPPPDTPEASPEAPPELAIGYIDPLFDLEGHALTGSGEDGGPGGLFWCWAGQTEKGTFDLCSGVGVERTFERKIHVIAEPTGASLAHQYAWLDPSSGDAFAIETVLIDIKPSMKAQRLLELEITLRNVGESVLKLTSPPAPQTVGLHLLTNPSRSLSGVALMPVEEGTTAGNWASVSLRIPRSSRYSGVAIFPDPEKPGSIRPQWVIPRIGVLAAAWPPRTTVELQPGEAYQVRYGLYIHRGQGRRSILDPLYSEYILNRDLLRKP